MEWVIVGVCAWIVMSVVRQAQKQARNQPPPPEFTDPALIPASHVRVVDGRMQAVISDRHGAEESSSELLHDETAFDHDLDAEGAVPVDLVPVESTVALATSAPRAVPVRETLEHEVDWNAEHERFHRRYVDVRAAPRAAGHGLREELRDPASLRRALLMKEILGPPLALRDDRER